MITKPTIQIIGEILEILNTDLIKFTRLLNQAKSTRNTRYIIGDTNHQHIYTVGIQEMKAAAIIGAKEPLTFSDWDLTQLIVSKFKATNGKDEINWKAFVDVEWYNIQIESIRQNIKSVSKPIKNYETN